MHFSLSMGGNQIERTNSYKYLGITVDDKIKSPNIKMSVGADIVQTSA